LPRVSYPHDFFKQVHKASLLSAYFGAEASVNVGDRKVTFILGARCCCDDGQGENAVATGVAEGIMS
jgi:hypothetical protein